MNSAAVANPIASRNRTRAWIILGGAVALTLGISCLYAFERGPFICNNGCLVQSPVIDARTQQYLDSILAPIDRVPMAMYATGTTYMICNTAYCTTYRQSFDGRYVGDARTKIEGRPSGPRPGTGGGPVGGGGGSPGTGGTVIVGPPVDLNTQ